MVVVRNVCTSTKQLLLTDFYEAVCALPFTSFPIWFIYRMSLVNHQFLVVYVARCKGVCRQTLQMKGQKRDLLIRSVNNCNIDFFDNTQIRIYALFKKVHIMVVVVQP